MELKQKRYLTKKHFVIKDESLFVKVKSLFYSYEHDIPFEDIVINRITTYQNINPLYGILSLVCGLLFLSFTLIKLFISYNSFTWEAILLLLAGTIFCSTMTIIFYKHEFLIPVIEKNPIQIYRAIPNRIIPEQFKRDIQISVRRYMLNKYILLAKNLEFEARTQYLFDLFERGVLFQNEYEEAIERLERERYN